MTMKLEKGLVFEIKRTQSSETFTASKHNFNAHLGVFWSNFSMVLLLVDLISLTHWILCSCIFPLPYIVISEISIIAVYQNAGSIDQFRYIYIYIKIQPQTIDLITRLRGINTEFVGLIPQSLVLRSIVWDWILIYRNWPIHLFLYYT